MSESKPFPWRRTASLAAVFLVSACSSQQGCQRTFLWGGVKPITITSEKAARRNLTELVVATGKVQPVTQVKISPEVSGEIIELPVKEGQAVKKGEVLVKIRPDFYQAAVGQAQASYQSALSGTQQAVANAAKAEAEFKRFGELYNKKLVSGSDFDGARTGFDAQKAAVEGAGHQAEQAAAFLKKAQEDLLKTTILAPMDGTVSKLISEKGERVVGTGMMAGTEIMTVAELSVMEARVEVGEVDVVLIAPGQKARLEVDSFKDRKFAGTVTQVARSAKSTAVGTQSEATKFEVRIRIDDKEPFLPGMSVTAEVETRYRSNVITVPIQSVTTRLSKTNSAPDHLKSGSGGKGTEADKDELELVITKRKVDKQKPPEVVFAVEGGKAKMIPVKRGISDDTYYEILEGVTEGLEVITGSFKALSRELEDGKAVKIEDPNKKKDTRAVSVQ